MEVVQAIVLKVFNFSDNQKIVHAFSKERGYISLISPSSFFRKRNCTVHLMQVVEAEIFYTEKSSLYKLKSVTPLVNLSALYFDIYKMNIALLWGEVLDLILKNEQKNIDLFNFILQSVEYLNETVKDIANFNLFFLYRLATLIGFKIDTSTYEEGYVLDINGGVFIPCGGKEAYVSGPNAAQVIHKLCSCQVEELADIVLDRKSRSILLDIILLFFSIHLNTDFNIKSIKVIREVFD